MSFYKQDNSKFIIIIFFTIISIITTGFLISDDNFEGNHSEIEIPESSQGSENKIVMYLFINPACEICLEKNNTVNNFLLDNSEIEYHLVEIYASNITADEFAYEFFDTNLVPNPSVVFVRGDCKLLLEQKYITIEDLTTAYNQLNESQNICDGWETYKPYSIGTAFFTGLISGLSPCIILVTGLIGTSLFSTKSKSIFISNMVSFILAVLLAYLFIGLLFWYFLDFAQLIFNGLLLKLLIGIPLISLGLWYIIDAWNEKSKLFNTPEKFKKFFKTISGKNSLVSAFILGFSFTLLKSPCIAGVLLSLLFNISSGGSNSGEMFTSLLLFGIGVIIPILILFIILRLGIASEKIDNNRKKFRPYLRIISGLIIIITTLISII